MVGEADLEIPGASEEYHSDTATCFEWELLVSIFTLIGHY